MLGLTAAFKLLSPKLIVKIIDYVTKDNVLDVQMRATIEQVTENKEDITNKTRDTEMSLHEIIMRIEKLEEKSHPKKDFVRCKECEERITRASELMQRAGDETI